MDAIFRQVRQQAETDSAMLESMATALRAGLPFSFHADDMADLLDRLRAEHVAHLIQTQR